VSAGGTASAWIAALGDLGRFTPISLEELNRRAPLLDRQENKYVVPAATWSAMANRLVDDFDLLAIEGVVSFTYETTYYDTGDLLTYRHHAQSRRRRFKVRSRHYVDSGECFFEIKLKAAQGRTVKERLPSAPHMQGAIDPAAIEFVRGHVRSAYGAAFDAPLVPALTMRYQRLTFVGRGAEERVTIDSSLTFSTPAGNTASAPPDVVIVEVKSPTGRGAADAAFREVGVRSMSCSKYCVGLNLVGDDVRYNPFKSVLTHHFGWEPPVSPATADVDDVDVPYPRVVDLLIAEFGDQLAVEIRSEVTEQAQRLTDARVGNYLEILVHRAARRALAPRRDDPRGTDVALVTPRTGCHRGDGGAG
jgi:VTC domain